MQSVPEMWRGVKRIHPLGGEQEMLCLSEQGVYFFLERSDKKKALSYQIWIAGEVVPSIRKHGAYLTPQKQEELIANPDLIIRLAHELKAVINNPDGSTKITHTTKVTGKGQIHLVSCFLGKR